jgi:hypothetical protein
VNRFEKVPLFFVRVKLALKLSSQRREAQIISARGGVSTSGDFPHCHNLRY